MGRRLRLLELPLDLMLVILVEGSTLVMPGARALVLQLLLVLNLRKVLRLQILGLLEKHILELGAALAAVARTAAH